MELCCVNEMSLCSMYVRCGGEGVCVLYSCDLVNCIPVVLFLIVYISNEVNYRLCFILLKLDQYQSSQDVLSLNNEVIVIALCTVWANLSLTYYIPYGVEK